MELQNLPRVLIISNDRFVGSLVRTRISNLGWRDTEVADTTDRALGLLSLEPFDAIILDSGIGEEAYTHIMRSLRKSGDARPVLMLDRSGASARARMMAAGVNAFTSIPAGFRHGAIAGWLSGMLDYLPRYQALLAQRAA